MLPKLHIKLRDAPETHAYPQCEAVRQWCRGERNDLPNITEAAEFVIGAETLSSNKLLEAVQLVFLLKSNCFKWLCV